MGVGGDVFWGAGATSFRKGPLYVMHGWSPKSGPTSPGEVQGRRSERVVVVFVIWDKYSVWFVV